MKVLLINGSPHEKGCTYTALEEVASALQANGVETEIFWIGNKPIGGCIGCGACFREKKGCVFGAEDGVNECTAKIKEADGVVVGSPVHFASAGGNICAFLDRVFYSKADFAGKLGASVVSCRRGGNSAAFDRLNKYFTISAMPVVSSNYWNGVHGNSPAEVKQDLEGMQIMRNLGNQMAWLLKCIEAGREKGIERPDIVFKDRTNFIR